MIIEIRLANFFSIHEEVVLSMQAANLQTKQAKDLLQNTFVVGKERLLKTVALYGANASGKSNIIRAIRACVRMIFDSHNYNENTIFDFVPFKFADASQTSSFFIRFMMNEVEYEYSFSLNVSEIVTESLYYYPKGRRSLVFMRDERKVGAKEKYEFRSMIKRPLDVAANTSRKTLFISRASQMGRPIAQDVFGYFYNRFILGYIGYNASSAEQLLQLYKDSLLQVLNIADSDIVNIESRTEPATFTSALFDGKTNKLLSMDSLQKQSLMIQTFHKNNPTIPFDFYTEESLGTQELFNRMLTILDVIKNGKVLLVDEIEEHLHTKLVEFILNMFHQSNSAQLICTTHNTNLLDMKLLRKDQIYFVNKCADGSSDLYSLFDYKDFRENMDAEKAYLQGRFDAIPYVDNSSSTLKSLI